MSDDSIAQVRADFEALKAKLKASVDQLEPERYDEVVQSILAFDGDTIRERIQQRRGSHRIGKMMAEIERRIATVEERERGRA